MAHFKADIQGSRGSVSRLGGKRSGISSHTRGWNVGARVHINHNEKTGKDEVQVYRTGGSSSGGRSKLVAEFTAIQHCLYSFHDSPFVIPFPIAVQ